MLKSYKGLFKNKSFKTKNQAAVPNSNYVINVPSGEGLCGVNLFLAHRIRISEILPWDRKSYLTHAILPSASSNVTM